MYSNWSNYKLMQQKHAVIKVAVIGMSASENTDRTQG